MLLVHLHVHLHLHSVHMTMLSGQAYGLDCLWLKFGCNARVLRPDVNKAIGRLEGFAFVGVTELYDLSICLFHAMHGGPCLPVEFANTRPGRSHGAPVPTSTFTAWGGAVDGYDWKLYSEVLRLFFRNLQWYGVNEAKCQALCPVTGMADRFAEYNQLFQRLRL